MTWSFADAFTAADGTLVLGKPLTDGSGKRWRPGAFPTEPDTTFNLIVQDNRAQGQGGDGILGRVVIEAGGPPWFAQCKVYGSPGDGTNWVPRVGPYAAGYVAVADANDANDGDAIRLKKSDAQVGIYNLGSGVFLADGDVIRLDVNPAGNVTAKLNGTTRVTVAWSSGALTDDHAIGFIVDDTD